MPCNDWYYCRPISKDRAKALDAWERYYFARGVSRFRCRTLAEQKCRKSNHMPPA